MNGSEIREPSSDAAHRPEFWPHLRVAFGVDLGVKIILWVILIPHVQGGLAATRDLGDYGRLAAKLEARGTHHLKVGAIDFRFRLPPLPHGGGLAHHRRIWLPSNKYRFSS